MKRTLCTLAVLLLAAAAPAVAGGEECAAQQAQQALLAANKAESKCSYDTQECLNYMAEKFRTKGWVGIEMDYDEEAGTLTITRVEPGSPAKQAGLQKGDVMTAMNGIQFSEANKDAMKSAQEKMTIGSTVVYTVNRGGKIKDVDVKLGEIPETVLAKWIGRHMLEHATIEVAQR